MYLYKLAISSTSKQTTTYMCLSLKYGWHTVMYLSSARQMVSIIEPGKRRIGKCEKYFIMSGNMLEWNWHWPKKLSMTLVTPQRFSFNAYKIMFVLPFIPMCAVGRRKVIRWVKRNVWATLGQSSGTWRSINTHYSWLSIDYNDHDLICCSIFGFLFQFQIIPY